MVAQLTGQAKEIVSNLKKSNKSFSSIKDWVVSAPEDVKTGCNTMPEFHKKIAGFTRMFTVLNLEQKMLYMCKIVHESINEETEELVSTLSIGTISTKEISITPSVDSYFKNSTDDFYTYKITTKLDSMDFWKPVNNGFFLEVHENNANPYIHELLTYIKSRASQDFYIVNIYTKKTNLSPKVDSSKHKNLMGCILKNSFANLYAASTSMRNMQ